MAERFGQEYTAGYEIVSGVIGAYEVWAKSLVKRALQEKPDAREVLEIGSGTGNSAIVLLEEAPSVAHVYGIEPGDFIGLAHAKQGASVKEFFEPATAPAYSVQMEQRMQKQKDRFHLIKAKGEDLPMREASMDVIFMNQVFHWLQPEQALKEIHRVLKPDGIMVFDESEYHFDFGDSPEGQQIKSEQSMNHPFTRLFDKILSQKIQQRTTVPVQPFRYRFTLESLRSLLKTHGFELVPDPAGNPYTISKVRYGLDQAMSMAENGAKMRMMAQAPELLDTPGLAEQMIQEAMTEAKQQWDQLPQTGEAQYGPSQAAFVARKTDIS